MSLSNQWHPIVPTFSSFLLCFIFFFFFLISWKLLFFLETWEICWCDLHSKATEVPRKLSYILRTLKNLKTFKAKFNSFCAQGLLGNCLKVKRITWKFWMDLQNENILLFLKNKTSTWVVFKFSLWFVV